jgi:uncharacterized protein YyaL (SSP411 family)
MPHSTIEESFDDLLAWCRQRDFAGYDPFDALNSRVFQSTPFRHSRIARLLWTQAFKRSPINLRPLALVPPQQNAKGLALFALAALADYRRLRTAEAEAAARDLLDQLLALRIVTKTGVAWGYNFDWQSRNFFAPRGTPTIVPTAFAAQAFIEAAEVFGDSKLFDVATSISKFILFELAKSEDEDGSWCFGYSTEVPTRIYNASLLAGETLARVGVLVGDQEYCDMAMRTARYVLKHQGQDGSWNYGAEPSQNWIDNFHTAFLLASISRIIKAIRTMPQNVVTESFINDATAALRRGYEFWRERFFLADGWPKYYHDALYPADAHAAATAIITLLELQELDGGALALAEKIADWTVRDLRDREGFFYYQRRRFYTVHTPYMRWTQAWMLYALARLLEVKQTAGLRTVGGNAG